MSTTRRVWLQDLLLILILVAATYLRVVGMNWDDEQHLHPDERFLTMVETVLQVQKCSSPGIPLEACPADQVRWIGPADYLNTATSPLNPQNRGYGFFVYGDFPVILVRYIAQWVGQTGYDQVHLVGRQVSALGDLLTIVLIYLIALRLYGRATALLTAAFTSLSVLEIQQSHFFTVDTLANLFIFLALYLAVAILLRTRAQPYLLADEEGGPPGAAEPSIWWRLFGLKDDPFFRLSVGFGIAAALAVASKLNAAPLVVMLPAAFIIRYFVEDRGRVLAGGVDEANAYWSKVALYVVSGAIAAVVTFRLAMPYAFDGLGLNPAWLANIRDLMAQSSGNADVPFALQWARRSHLFSFKNLTVWGLGLPLGILAWTGFLFMAWRIFRGKLHHAVLWGWTAMYFGWQSTVFNPTMRYQMPVYPALCLMAAWFVVYLWRRRQHVRNRIAGGALAAGSVVLAVTVLVLSAAWAFAFTRIYTRPVTRIAATRWIFQNVPAPANLRIRMAGGSVYQQPLSFPTGGIVSAEAPFLLQFTANASGTLESIYLPHVSPVGTAAPQTLKASISLQPLPDLPDTTAAATSLTSNFAVGSDLRGGGYTLTMTRPLELIKGQTYFARMETDGGVMLTGAAPINETDWDDGLPLRFGPEGYDAYGGLYENDLNLQIYWDDNADKLQRFVSTLTRGDYIFISSNRQWATVTRVPERYPLTTTYYRDLIGCPPDKDVIWCYNVGRPGMFEGKLGYKLVAVFESFPSIDIPGVLKWEVNDQFAEEAFTVYDHPKVLIFQKQPDYSEQRVQQLLGAVDLSNVVFLTPREAGSYKSLMLSAVKWAQQRAGGTWSQLFSYGWMQNRFPVVGLLLWYVFILILGLLTYPIIRKAMPGLGDKGYPAARILGLVLFAGITWLGGSFGVPVTRTTVAAVFLALAAIGVFMAWRQRAELREEWATRRRYFLAVEGLFLLFFAADLLVRIGNPDLWHPAKGGERPMDFSYFNAVIKSTSFPPYDPWFAGGYINYYYYGYVLMAMPVKLLGIVPSLAYNFILPTLFAMVAMAAFSAAWNLLDRPGEDANPHLFDPRLLAGLLAATLMVLLGNLGTVRMIYQGLQRLGAPGGYIDGVDIVQRLIWMVQGIGRLFQGGLLPYGPGDWYWNPSRVIPPGPGNEITEFPLFTFLYSDLHAHMLAMPIALLALIWALSVVKSRRITLLSLVIGGAAIGALYPTNLSDIYTYLPLGFAVMAYTMWRSPPSMLQRLGMPEWLRKVILIGGAIVVLTVLAYGLYQPYRASYSQGYSAVEAWTGSHTPIWSYLTHWGLFLFIITGWLAWETREWMASTPVSSLNELRRYQIWIEAGIAAFLVTLLYLAYRGVEIGWVALPLAVWAGLLMLRPGMPDGKRFALFLAGTALLISIMVEIIVVRGDIGRMNTVFKFYLQGWALFSVSAAAALVWLLPEMAKWLPSWRNFFQAGLAVLFAGAALYTISATSDKIGDRMAPGVPLTLDSITYMQYAQYADFNVVMNLDQDYEAIRWMQDHVPGSPVIVEANCPEYHWCTRFTIYTGLPGVVGWNWHQRQQRTLTPQLVEQRVTDIGVFYTTSDIQEAEDFLKRYNVRYIIVGQLERAEYAGPGLSKFVQYDGRLWDAVYQNGDTTIYQVRP
jgi:YYY domain-containing protein